MIMDFILLYKFPFCKSEEMIKNYTDKGYKRMYKLNETFIRATLTNPNNISVGDRELNYNEFIKDYLDVIYKNKYVGLSRPELLTIALTLLTQKQKLIYEIESFSESSVIIHMIKQYLPDTNIIFLYPVIKEEDILLKYQKKQMILIDKLIMHYHTKNDTLSSIGDEIAKFPSLYDIKQKLDDYRLYRHLLIEENLLDKTKLETYCG